MFSNPALTYYRNNGVRIGYIALPSALYACIRSYIVAPTTLADIIQNCPKPGFLIDVTSVVLQLLSIPLNETFVLPMPDRNFGSFVNGTWFGKVGNVSRGEIDITFPYMTPTLQRQNAVDFSAPIATVALGFLTRYIFMFVVGNSSVPTHNSKLLMSSAI